ncbi:hypothetical protein JTB14_011776 [Gonioctena quinquepunctata]|nr:hypothetical protein JTB14_011776 [Gonioctena quinquepunctata]
MNAAELMRRDCNVAVSLLHGGDTENEKSDYLQHEHSSRKDVPYALKKYHLKTSVQPFLMHKIPSIHVNNLGKHLLMNVKQSPIGDKTFCGC